VALVEVDRVSHWYGRGGAGRVLEEVSLSVSQREIVAIVGESGCGKTTLGRIVVGLVRPMEGSVSFEGADVWSVRGREERLFRRSVQLVHQDPFASLNPAITIGSSLGPAILYHGLATRRTLQERLLALLSEVGLEATPAFLRRYPHQLSGGQRQRVAIARAISLEPSLVVADEVTSMLDVSMRVAMLDLLLSLGDRHGMAFLFISHDLGVVRYFAGRGRVLVMFFGVVVEAGPTEDVISRPRHPYTYLLLEAVPVPDPELAAARAGNCLSSSSDAGPSRRGCVFVNRCPFSERKCHEARPPLVDNSEGHWVACFFPERVPPLSHYEQGFSSCHVTPVCG
jgi:oligopeptide/dipeptide ABC transporter ATP-binding protein